MNGRGGGNDSHAQIAANEPRHVSFSSVVDAFENQSERELAVIEAARRVAFAFNRYRSRYEDRWQDFRPQKESLDALDVALRELDGDA